jgi:hypothetical protein
MATWHQMRARKRPGFRLFHETKWTVLCDPPGSMASAMLFDTETQAQQWLAGLPADRQRHQLILRPAKETM